MAFLNKPIDEKTVIGLLFLIVLVYLIVFSQDFGLVYSVMLTAWLALYVLDINRSTTFKIEKSSSGRILSFVFAVLFYAGFLVVSAFLTNQFSPGSIASASDYKGVIALMGSGIAQAAQPALRNSLILLAFGFTFLIGTIETMTLVAKLMEFVHDRIPHTIQSLVMLVIMVGAAAVIYHFSSKNLANVPLMITFTFFTLSAVMVLVFGQVREAIIMHWMANAIAILGLMNGLYFMAAVFGIIYLMDAISRRSIFPNLS